MLSLSPRARVMVLLGFSLLEQILNIFSEKEKKKLESFSNDGPGPESFGPDRFSNDMEKVFQAHNKQRIEWFGQFIYRRKE